MVKSERYVKKAPEKPYEFGTEPEYDLDSIKEISLYMPDKKQQKYLVGKVRKILEDYKHIVEEYRPKTVKEFVLQAALGPQGYLLWKLPPDVHKKVNELLKYASGISAKFQPEVGMAVGLGYFISQVMYGIKTKSGKHLISGLTGIGHSAKKMKIRGLEELASSTLGDMASAKAAA
jgi:hypothetical protein